MDPVIAFRPDKAVSNERDEVYRGSLSSYDQLRDWAQQKCVPFVREITFENAEELTEEGLPFLILFYHPTDTESIKLFKDVVTSTLLSEKGKYIFFFFRNIKSLTTSFLLQKISTF